MKYHMSCLCIVFNMEKTGRMHKQVLRAAACRQQQKDCEQKRQTMRKKTEKDGKNGMKTA